jgi:hypothetical protein
MAAFFVGVTEFEMNKAISNVMVWLRDSIATMDERGEPEKLRHRRVYDLVEKHMASLLLPDRWPYVRHVIESGILSVEDDTPTNGLVLLGWVQQDNTFGAFYGYELLRARGVDEVAPFIKRNHVDMFVSIFGHDHAKLLSPEFQRLAMRKKLEDGLGM